MLIPHDIVLSIVGLRLGPGLCAFIIMVFEEYTIMSELLGSAPGGIFTMLQCVLNWDSGATDNNVARFPDNQRKTTIFC